MTKGEFIQALTKMQDNSKATAMGFNIEYYGMPFIFKEPIYVNKFSFTENLISLDLSLSNLLNHFKMEIEPMFSELEFKETIMDNLRHSKEFTPVILIEGVCLHTEFPTTITIYPHKQDNWYTNLEEVLLRYVIGKTFLDTYNILVNNLKLEVKNKPEESGANGVWVSSPKDSFKEMEFTIENGIVTKVEVVGEKL